MKTSADEMGYGMTVLWLAVLVIFLGIAALYNQRGFVGYGMLAFGVLGLIRSARHMAESFRMAEHEDRERQRQYEAWIANIEHRTSNVEHRSEEEREILNEGGVL